MIAPTRGPNILGWDASRPLESFKAFAKDIHEKAKSMLVKDGRHAEIIMFVPLNGPSQIVQCKAKNRDALAEWIKQHIRQHYIYGVVHIAESWMRLTEGPNDTTMKKLASGQMRVSELPENQRREALIVLAQTRDGYSHTWVDLMIRDQQSGSLKLGECMEFDNPAGRLGGLFR